MDAAHGEVVRTRRAWPWALAVLVAGLLASATYVPLIGEDAEMRLELMVPTSQKYAEAQGRPQWALAGVRFRPVWQLIPSAPAGEPGESHRVSGSWSGGVPFQPLEPLVIVNRAMLAMEWSIVVALALGTWWWLRRRFVAAAGAPAPAPPAA